MINKIALMLLTVLFITSCGKPKKQENKQETAEIDKIIDDVEHDKEVSEVAPIKEKTKQILDPSKGLLVIFKDNIDIVETEKLIEDKGLKLEKEWIDDKNSLKIGIIKVPANEKEDWLNELLESGRFRDVKLYSEENLNKLLEDRKKSKK